MLVLIFQAEELGAGGRSQGSTQSSRVVGSYRCLRKFTGDEELGWGWDSKGQGQVRDDGLDQGRGSRLVRRTLLVQQLFREKELLPAGLGVGWDGG